jgi:hypothetical protein
MKLSLENKNTICVFLFDFVRFIATIKSDFYKFTKFYNVTVSIMI